ncbi:hypothetical protein ACFYYH_01195 [Streptomyces sp. NPDC002018]
MALLHEPTPGASAEPVFDRTARAGRRRVKPYKELILACRPSGD